LFNASEILQITESNIYLAIIDQRNYPNIESGTKSYSDIFFQQPQFISNRGMSKINTTINCVHALRGVDDKQRAQIDSWIRINQGFGVGKISLCHIGESSEDKHLRRLQNEHGEFIQVVKLETRVEQVCRQLGLDGSLKDGGGGGRFCNKKFFNEIMEMREKICDNQW
jgi:hypothetical protein